MNIRLLVMDVDGTLTDGKIYMSSTGELMKAFNIKDGFAIARLKEYQVEPVIITGRSSEIVRLRCEELKVRELYQGVENKSFKLRELCQKYSIELDNVAFIGDDLNDLPCIKICGFSACPADAAKEVRSQVDFICESRGGEGAVREFIDYIVSTKKGNLCKNEFVFNEIKYEIDGNIND